MLEWASVRVMHLKYGEGVVLSCENGFVHVSFSSVGEKQFLYPDAFERFLKTTEPAAIAQITQDIIFKKAEENAIEREKKQLAETIAAAKLAAEAGASRARKKTVK